MTRDPYRYWGLRQGADEYLPKPVDPALRVEKVPRAAALKMGELVVVEVGARRLGIPAARVREVAAVSTVTPVPTAPPPVVGLTQLRGHIIPVLDLATPVRAPRPKDSLIVVELGPARAALLVDRVLGDRPADGVELLDVGALFDGLRAAVPKQ